MSGTFSGVSSGTSLHHVRMRWDPALRVLWFTLDGNENRGRPDAVRHNRGPAERAAPSPLRNRAHFRARRGHPRRARRASEQRLHGAVDHAHSDREARVPLDGARARRVPRLARPRAAPRGAFADRRAGARSPGTGRSTASRAPAQPDATPGNGYAVVSWPPVTDATSFNVYYSELPTLTKNESQNRGLQLARPGLRPHERQRHLLRRDRRHGRRRGTALRRDLRGADGSGHDGAHPLRPTLRPDARREEMGAPWRVVGRRLRRRCGPRRGRGEPGRVQRSWRALLGRRRRDAPARHAKNLATRGRAGRRGGGFNHTARARDGRGSDSPTARRHFLRIAGSRTRSSWRPGSSRRAPEFTCIERRITARRRSPAPHSRQKASRSRTRPPSRD